MMKRILFPLVLLVALGVLGFGSPAFAQSGLCGAGKPCRVNTLTVQDPAGLQPAASVPINGKIALDGTQVGTAPSIYLWYNGTNIQLVGAPLTLSGGISATTYTATASTTGLVDISIPVNTWLDFSGAAPGGAPSAALRYNGGTSGFEFNQNFLTLSAGGVGMRADTYGKVGGGAPTITGAVISGDVLPDVANTRNMGNGTFPWANVQSQNATISNSLSAQFLSSTAGTFDTTVADGASAIAYKFRGLGGGAGYAVAGAKLFDMENNGTSEFSIDKAGITVIGPAAGNTITETPATAGAQPSVAGSGTDTNVGLKLGVKGTHAIGFPSATPNSYPSCTASTYSSSQTPQGSIMVNSTTGKPSYCDGVTWRDLAGAELAGSRRAAWMQALNTNATALSGVGMDTPTVSCTGGSQGGGNTLGGRLSISYTTGATANQLCGIAGPYLETMPILSPRTTFLVSTAGTITLERVWVGIAGADLSGSDASNPAGGYCAFRYSTGAADTTWQACSSDGAAISCTNTAVTVVATTLYHLVIDNTISGHCIFTVNGAQFDKSSNIPTSGTAQGFQGTVTTLTTAARSIQISRVTLED